MIEDLTLAEVVAYNHKVMDRDAFMEQLGQLLTVRSSIMSRQLMLGVVEELDKVGFADAAHDLRQFAETLPHVWELPSDYAHERHHQEHMAKEKAAWEKRNSSLTGASKKKRGKGDVKTNQAPHKTP
jgi:hypothetical protein